MLTLLKQNLISTKKKFLIMYIIIFAFFILFPITLKLNDWIMGTSSVLATIITNLFVGLIPILLIILAILILRDSLSYIKDSLFSKQGYLNFTLPFKTSSIVLSKLLTALIWMFGFVACAFVGSLIMEGEMQIFFPMNDSDMSYTFIVFRFITQILDNLNLLEGTTTLQVIILTFCALLSVPYLIVLYLFSNIVVNITKMKKHKKTVSSLVFVLLLIALGQFTQLIIAILMSIANGSLLLPLLVNLIIEVAVIIIGYQLSIYWINYKLELV